jgi:hypothetical protein
MKWYKVSTIIPNPWRNKHTDNEFPQCGRCYILLAGEEKKIRLYYGNDKDNSYLELCSNCTDLYEKEYKQFRELFLKGSGPKLYCYACNDLMGEYDTIVYYWGKDSDRKNSKLCKNCAYILQKSKDSYIDQWFENHNYKLRMERSEECCICKAPLPCVPLQTHPFDINKLFCPGCGESFKSYLDACKKRWLGGL